MALVKRWGWMIKRNCAKRLKSQTREAPPSFARFSSPALITSHQQALPLIQHDQSAEKWNTPFKPSPSALAISPDVDWRLSVRLVHTDRPLATSVLQLRPHRMHFCGFFVCDTDVKYWQFAGEHDSHLYLAKCQRSHKVMFFSVINESYFFDPSS